jgi:hypothetical protein
MKKNLLFPAIAFISVLILSSCCSVQKRLYRDGYSIEWNHKKNEVKRNISQDQTVSDQIADANDNVVSKDPVEIKDEAAKVDKDELTASAKEKPAVQKKKSLISKIIREDTPEETERINNGSKAAAFKSGFKKGLKLMMPVEDGKMTGWAVASFVLGLLSLFAYYGSFLLGVLAIIFGIIAIRKIRNEGFRGNTLAWLGIIFGIIGIILATIIIQVVL